MHLLTVHCSAPAHRASSSCPPQDSPAVKSSYSAAVRVPAELTAVMSAVPCDGPPPLPGSTDGGTAPEGTPHLPEAAVGDSSTRVFYFHQATPIPSYLTALAVGHLESRELSDRWGAWCVFAPAMTLGVGTLAGLPTKSVLKVRELKMCVCCFPRLANTQTPTPTHKHMHMQVARVERAVRRRVSCVRVCAHQRLPGSSRGARRAVLLGPL